MTNEERKEIIRKLLKEGQTLSQIQDFLSKEKGDSITYMELRLLLSDMPDAKLPEEILRDEGLLRRRARVGDLHREAPLALAEHVAGRELDLLVAAMQTESDPPAMRTYLFVSAVALAAGAVTPPVVDDDLIGASLGQLP